MIIECGLYDSDNLNIFRSCFMATICKCSMYLKSICFLQILGGGVYICSLGQVVSFVVQIFSIFLF